MRKRVAAVAAALALMTACTADGGDARGSDGSPSAEPWHGGTLRVMTWLRTVRQLDPATSYLQGIHWELYRCCLLRTLMSYNGRAAVDGGAEPLPDLAAEPPEVSSDGLTWTFRLREGLTYAPPFEDTEIVAGDVVRALERIPPPGPDVFEYGFHYSVIEGFDAYRAGEADSIVGLETPDDHTLIVHLTRQVGDLPYRFTMGATAPVPPGAAEGNENDYMRFLVSSGPYMIEGSEDLDFSLPPEDQVPVAGFTPQGDIDDAGEPSVGLTLVRNPSWDPSTDPLRGAYVDRMEFTMVPGEELNTPETARTFGRRLDEGTIDVLPGPSAAQLERYGADPLLRGRIVTIAMNDLFYMPMNLAVPPFDDVEVRRAVNLAIDKAAIATRTSTPGTPATPLIHLFPDTTEASLIPPGWRPAWSSDADSGGDADAARRVMARSSYDADGDGRCDADVCRHVDALVEDQMIGPDAPSGWFWRQVHRDLLQIGIRLEPTVLECFDHIEMASRPPEHIALTMGYCMAWGADFPSASPFAQALLHSDALAEVGNTNYSLLGASGDRLRAWGYEASSVPSADAQIDACLTATGRAQIECWADLDRYITEEIVPWVPLYTTGRTMLLSGRIAHWSYSEYGLRPAFDRIALVPGSE